MFTSGISLAVPPDLSIRFSLKSHKMCATSQIMSAGVFYAGETNVSGT
jgi:hypothetical protein